MTHDSCATAGCHNYHDNKALYENFLYTNVDQPDVLDTPAVTLRDFIDQWDKKRKADAPDLKNLEISDADAPSDLLLRPIVKDWLETAHAAAGVNCRACHDHTSDDGKVTQWKNKVGQDACAKCHEFEASSFVQGRHGMRLANNMA